jgi:hypothetical protein
MELGGIVQHCQSMLGELNKILIKFKEEDPIAKGADGKPRRVWEVSNGSKRMLLSCKAGFHQIFCF